MKWMQYFEATRSGDLSNEMTVVGLLVFEIEQIHRLDYLLKNKRSKYQHLALSKYLKRLEPFRNYITFSDILTFFNSKGQVRLCLVLREMIG
jgi:hypothetical protein